MKRRIWMLVMVLALFFLLAGCKKNATDNTKKEEPVGNSNQTDSVDGTGKRKWSSEEYEDFFASIEPNEIVMVCDIFPRLSETDQKEINRILKEKGIDYQIRFLIPRDEEGNLIVDEYPEWVSAFSKKGYLDIITTSGWSYGDESQIQFYQKEMLPLNSYLETPAGSRLKEVYTDDEWKQCSIEGAVYGVPIAVQGAYTTFSTDLYLDFGTYIAVNDSYSAYFEEFDGTYASLRRIYKSIGDNDLRIVIPSLPAINTLYGLMGYSCLNETPFDYAEGRMADISQGDELHSLLTEISEDLKTGVLVNQDWGQEAPREKVLAYIHMGKRLLPEGFTDYCSAPALYDLNVRAKYGISAYSNKKEQAFEVLAACFSDIDLLGLFYQGADEEQMRELLQRRREYLAMNTESEWAGIYISYGEYTEKVREFYMSINRMTNRMKTETGYDSNGNTIYEYNPDYDLDLEEEWKKFKEVSAGYTDWCEYADRQIQEWKQDNSTH